MSFENLSLRPEILRAVAEAGYSTPTPIQCKAIPKIMRGFDIKAQGQTGTGKTAAFLLPILHHLSQVGGGKKPRALILVPTRELAMQITTQAKKYSKYLPRLRTTFVGGGIPFGMQLRDLSHPYDLLIATPGRLIDFMDRKRIDLSSIELLVLDEADRMLDMGFIEPVEQIVAAMPKARQTLLFSATLRGNVIKLSERLLNKPMEIVVHPEPAQQNNIEQVLHYADDLGHKNRLLDHILGQVTGHAIVFTATKRHADQLDIELQEKGHLSAALHGDMSQRDRTRTIAQLRNGKIKILVATDVAARGIDVQSISHVINFDLPRSAEDYVHRIGRTGRAGTKGSAVSLATRREALLVKKIEKYTGQSIELTEVAGLEERAPKSKSQRRPPFPYSYRKQRPTHRD